MKYIYVIMLSILMACEGSSVSNSEFNNGSSGIAGSLARFTIKGNYLYTVDNSTIKTFKISDKQNPSYLGSVKINAFAETIFPFKNHLLIGTRTGMQIYNLVNPEKPDLLSTYQHFASCDPVVADGDYAYVTLRNGTPCQRGTNQLDVIDISSMSKPVYVKSYQMVNPHGLGISGNTLFLCEGENGFKVLDKTDPLNVKELSYVKGLKSEDVIPLSDRIIVTGKNGISQYKYTKDGEMKLLSTIAVEQN